jgi:hypothetical protein
MSSQRKVATAVGEDGSGCCWEGRQWRLPLRDPVAATSPQGYDGGCCWLVGFVFPGREGEGTGGFRKKARGSKGRARESLQAKCSVTIDP